MYHLKALGYPAKRIKVPDSDPLAASRYLCIYWIDHLYYWSSDSNVDDLQDGGIVDAFIREKYLYWLEALSLCGGMSEGMVSMARLEALLQVLLGLAMLYSKN